MEGSRSQGKGPFIVFIYSLYISKPALQNIITVRSLCLKEEL